MGRAIEELESRFAPATLNWQGDDGTNPTLWSVAANWAENLAPTSGDTLRFDTATAGFVGYTATNDVAGLTGLTLEVADAGPSDFTISGTGVEVVSVTHASNGTTSLGVPLAIAGPVSIVNTSGTLIVGGAVTIGANTLTIDTTGPTTVSGSITGTSGGLTKNGTGTLTLAATNSFGGATTVNTGTLRVGTLTPASPAAYYSFDSVGGSVITNGGTLASKDAVFGGGAAATTGGTGLRGEGLSIPSQNAVAAINPTNIAGAFKGVDLAGGNWTASAWFNGLYGTGSWRTLFRGLTNDHQIIIEAGTWRLGTYNNGGGGFVPALNGVTPVDMSVYATGWHQVTAVATGTTTTFYINGVFVGTAAYKSTTDIFAIGNIQAGSIAGSINTPYGPVGSGQAFATRIDEVYLYQQALTLGEVGDLYTATATRNALPDASAVTVAGPATLDLNGNTETIGPLAGAGAVTLGTAGQLTVNSLVDTSYSGNISGAGGVIKAGPGKLTYATLNTYTGQTTVNAGTLEVTALTAPATIISNATVRFEQPIAGTYAGSISGSGGMTKAGAGTLTLTGVHSYTGQTSVAAGVLELGSNPTAPTGTAFWVDSSDLASLTTSSAYVSQWNDKSGNGRNLTQGTLANRPTLTPFAVNGYPAVRFDGDDVISNNFAFGNPYSIFTASRMQGNQNGRVITAFNNWLMGNWGGRQDVMHNLNWITTGGASRSVDLNTHLYGAVTNGTGSLTDFYDGSRLIASGAGGAGAPQGMSIGAWNGTPTSEPSRADVTEVVLFNSVLSPAARAAVVAYLSQKWLGILPDTSPVDVVGGATLRLNGYNDTIGSLSGAGGVVVTTGNLTVNSTTNTTFSGTITGSGGLGKSGTGTLTLSSANSYAGPTNILGGTLRLTASNSLPNTTATLNSPGVLDLNGQNEDFGVLVGNGTVTNNVVSAPLTSVLTLGVGGASSTFSGTIQNGSGVVAVTKTGAGTLTLTGSSTFTGLFDIQGGTVQAGLYGSTAAPVTLNQAIWLDASDAASVVQSGGLVSQWSDKSGNARNFIQGTAAAQPIYYADALNGLPAIRFDGADVISNAFNVGNRYSILTVSQMHGAPAQRLITSVGSNWLLGYHGGQEGVAHFDGWVNQTGTPATTNPHLYRSVGYGSSSLFADGNRFIAENNGGLTGPNGLSLGAFAANPANERSQGMVNELLLYQRPLNYFENQQVVDYLTAKWYGVLPDTAAINVGPGANLNFQNVNDTVGPLSGTGAVNLGTGTVTVNAVSAASFGGVVAGAGNLAKTGPARQTLTGPNNYTGGTTVRMGALGVGNATALGGTGTGTVVQSGGQLVLTGGITSAEPITISGPSNANFPAILNEAGANSLTGPITQAAAPTANTWSIGSFTGGDLGDGLDLDGNIAAINAGGTSTVRIRDANFIGSEPNNVPGTIQIGTNQIASPWISGVNFGATANDDALEGVMSSIRWSSAPTTITADFPNLVAGRRYKLQILTQENGSTRGFDIRAEGTTLVPLYGPYVYMGGTTVKTRGALFTYEFTAGDPTLNVVLAPTSGVFGDNNPILNAITLEDLSPRLDIVSQAGTLTLGSSISSSNVVFGGAGDILVNGPILDVGGTTVTKTGAGTTTLNTANAYSGTTSIQGGMLVVGNALALGTTAAGTTVTDGGTLGLTGGITVAGETLAIVNTVSGGSDEIVNLSGNNVWTGAVSLSYPAQSSRGFFFGGDPGEGLDLDGNFFYATNFGGAAGIATGGTVFFNEGFPGITFSAPNVIANWISGINYGATTNDDGLENVMRAIRYAGGAVVSANFAGVVPGRLYKTQILIQEIPTYALRGFDVIAEGAIIDNDFPTGWVSSNIVGGVITHQYSPLDTTLNIALDPFADPFANNDPVLNGVTIEDLGRRGIGVNSVAGSLVLSGLASDNAEIVVSGAGAVVFTAAITDTAGTNLVKNGAGTLTLLAANGFTGSVALNAGTIGVGNGAALGTAAGATTIQDGARLVLNGGTTVAEPIVVVSNSTAGTTHIENGSGANTLTGTVSLTSSVASQGLFTGGDPGEGLDLTGTFPYAVNFGGTAAGPVNGVTFTNSEGGGTPGLVYSAPGVVGAWFAPDFGASANDNALEAITQSIRHANVQNGTIQLDFANLVAGNRYKVQLLVDELTGYGERGFDIYAEGVLVADDFGTGVANSVGTGRVVTFEYTATDSLLTISLVGATATQPDRNPILNAVTIENLGVAPAPALRVFATGGSLTVNGDVVLGAGSGQLQVSGGGNVTINGLVDGKNYAQTVLAGGPTGYWRLDETALGTVVDSVGGRNGTHVSTVAGNLNQPGGLAGDTNTSLQFTGGSQYVSVPHDAGLNTILSGNYTISFLMFKDSEAGDWQRLVGKGADPNRTVGVWEEAGGGRRILFQVYTSGTALNFFSNAQLDVGRWYHVSVTVNGTTGSIYIDGALDATANYTGTILLGTEPLTFGRAPTLHTTLPGRMDEIAIYNRALSGDEIRTLSNVALAGVSTQAIVKSGPGTLTLTADNNRFFGTTSVNGGTLLANNAIGSATGSGAVSVNATGTLGGTGIIAGAVSVAANGTLNPGSPTSATESLQINGNVSFAAGSTFAVNLNGTTAVTQHDQLVVGGTGAVTIAPGAFIAGTTGFVPTNTVDKIKLIDKQSPGAISGTFTSFVVVNPPQSSPATVNIGGKTYDTNYADNSGPPLGNGNDLVLTAVAAQRVWDGLKDDTTTSGNDNWTNPLNWLGDFAPLEGDNLIFSNVGVGNRPTPVNDYAAGFDFSLEVTNTLGSYTLSGAEVDLAAPGLLHSSTTANSVSLMLSGPSGVTVSGAGGTLTLTNPSNNYAGATAITNGTLKLGVADVLPDTTDVTIAGPGTLDLNGFSESIDGLAGAGLVTSSVAGTPTLSVGANNQPTATFAGVIQNGAGTVSLTKIGSGDQTLSGTNTYTGLTSVGQGTLTLSGGSAIIDANSVEVQASGTLALASSEAIGALTLLFGTFDGADVTLGANALTLTGDVTVTAIGVGAIGAAITGIAGSSLNLNAAAPRTFTVDNGAVSNDLTIATNVTNGAVTKSGPGTMTYAGAQANTYAGATVVSDGVLSLDKDDNVTSIAGPGGVTIGDGSGGAASAVLRVDSDEQIVNTVLITLGGSDGQFFVTFDDTETILPLAVNFAGGDVRVAGELITTANYVQGPGVAGTTTLAGGTIRVLATGLGNYDLNNGTLQGTGTIFVTKLTNAATIDPGIAATSAGQIEIRGNLDILASGAVNLNVGGLSLPDFDQLNVLNNPGITPAAINVTNGTVQFRGTLNTGRIGTYVPSNLDAWDVMNFETRMLDTLAANHLRLPSDFGTKNLGPDAAGRYYDPRFLSASNQLNAESYNSTTFGMLGAPPPSVGLAKKLRLTALSALASDVTASTTLTKGGFTSNSTIRHQYQYVTVTNTTGSAINGPIYLEIPSVSLAGVKLYNRAGFTLSGGKEYVVVSPTGLGAGGSVVVQLDWLNPNMAAFTYTHRVLAGGLP